MAQLGGSLSSSPPPRRGAARLPEEAGRAPSAAGPATPSGVGRVPPDCPRAERFLSRPPAPPALALGDRCRGGHSTPHLQRVPRWAPGKRGQSRIQESHNTTNLLFQPLAHARPPVPPLRAAHRLRGKNSPHSTWGGHQEKAAVGARMAGVALHDGGQSAPPWAPARSASRLPPCRSLPPAPEPAADPPPPAPTLGSRPRGGAEQAPTGVLLFEVISRRARQGAPRTEGGSPPGARRPRLWLQRT